MFFTYYVSNGTILSSPHSTLKGRHSQTLAKHILIYPSDINDIYNVTDGKK